MRGQTVKTYRELRDRIDHLRRDDELLVLRGQSKLYGGVVTPSLARGRALGADATYRLWKITVLELLGQQVRDYMEWKRNRPKATEDSDDVVTSQHRGDSFLEALLQHYGAPSTFVDVTTSLDVALWFAHHRHHIEEAPLMAGDIRGIGQSLDPFGPLVAFDVAHYERAWNRTRRAYGYILVLAPTRPLPNRLQHGDYIDLSTARHDSRMLRQAAGLMYASNTVDGDDLSAFTKAIFRFRLPLRGAPAWVRDPDATRLFPSPDVDQMFASILSAVPFADELDRPFLSRRVLRIPEYYSTPLPSFSSDEWIAYRGCDQYLRPTFLFEFLARGVSPLLEVMVGDQRFQLRDALAILAPAASPYLVVTAPREAIQWTIEPQNSIFFEYPAMQLALSMSRTRYALAFYDHGTLRADVSLWPYARGVWVVRSGAQYWCRIFGKDPNAPVEDLIASRGHWFQFTDGELMLVGSRPKKGSEDAYHAKIERLALLHTLGAFAEVVEGTRTLAPAQFRPCLLLT
jgi:FRG domain